MVRRFRTKKSFFLFFRTSRVQALQGMSVKVSRKYSKIWLLNRPGQYQVVCNAQSWSLLKLSTYEETPYSMHFYRTEVQMFTPFLEMNLTVCTRVIWAPAKPLTYVLFLCPTFEIPRKTQISPPPKKKACLAEKKEKQSATGWQGFKDHVRQSSRSISKKWRGHWMLKKFWTASLNRPGFLRVSVRTRCGFQKS